MNGRTARTLNSEFGVALDPVRARLLACWAQLHGPTGKMHRAAILAAIDRHLDVWNTPVRGPDDHRPVTSTDRRGCR